MKVLALETSTMAGSAAIIDSEAGVIGEVTLNIRAVHSERLMPSVQWLVDSCRMRPDEIDGFAVSIGPGSFTGLRIGLSTVKGLAFAADKPLVAVRTLDAFAMRFPYCDRLVCPLLDARKNEIYGAIYRWENGRCMKLMDEVAVSPGEFLKHINEPAMFAGDGAAVHQTLIRQKTGGNASFAPPYAMYPSAAAVAEQGLRRLLNGEYDDPVTLTPFYIRKSEAEVRLKNRS
jgi:tRNA threonylcarbamoyladenosine biosynthesis protein TsaB